MDAPGAKWAEQPPEVGLIAADIEEFLLFLDEIWVQRRWGEFGDQFNGSEWDDKH